MLDQATQAVLDQMARASIKPLHEMTPAEAREFIAQWTLTSDLASSPIGADLIAVRTARVPVTGGTIPLRILVPNRPAAGVIVYYHGGGWMLTPPDIEATGRLLVQRTACVVVLVDYRLAPEYRFPTAVEDAYAAVRWVAARVDEIAGRPAPLIVAGDGAGGNLAAVVAIRALDLGEPSVDLQLLVCPVTDCDFETLSYQDPGNQLTPSRESMMWCWDHYAPVADARVHPHASPLRIGSTAGLPPAVIVTAEYDVVRDEGELYATRLLKAGVPVRHRRFDGQMHCFLTMDLPGSDEALRFVAEAIAEVLGPRQAQAS